MFIRVSQTRYSMKYRHCDGKLVLKVTDDKEVKISEILVVQCFELHLNYILFVVLDMSLFDNTVEI